MKAIYKKEMKAFFCTASGFVYIGVYLLIYSCFFIIYNVLGDNADIGTLLDNIIVSFVLLIPILTMRLFAEEKQSGTDKIYLSAPLDAWEIVMGKYLAAFTVFLIPQLAPLASGIIMVILHGQTAAEIFAVMTGYVLVGAAFIAVGMFVSAVTEKQLISAIISFAVCLALYMSDMMFSAFGGTFMEKIVKLTALTDYYKNFTAGIFDCTAVIYFISFSALFIIFTILKTESERCG